MSLSDYQQTYSWRGAIELGPLVIKVAEQLPMSEQTGLGQQLRLLMVELPGVIAMDLIDGENIRLHVALRLTAALELIERIYPALDTSDARTALATLIERLDSDDFDEKITTPQDLAEGVSTDLPNDDEADAEDTLAAPVTAAPGYTPVQQSASAPVQPGINRYRPASKPRETRTIHVQPDRRQ